MTRRTVRLSLELLAPALFALGALGSGVGAGCSATEKGNTFQNDGDSGGSAGQSQTSSGVGGGFGSGGLDAGFDPDGACAASEVEAKMIPLDIVIVLDRSGSMDDGVKWPGVTNALKGFINDPASSGITVGITYFPIDTPTDGDECNYANYEDLAVGLGPLPANANALDSSIGATYPGGDTPMFPALKGGLLRATQQQDANPDHKVIVVFATDGDPTACDPQDVPTIALLAGSALDYDGVQTFTIAMQGATVSALDEIAAAGGTTKAFNVTSNIQSLADKMAEIRQQSLSCQFEIPDPPMSQSLDPTKVNVVYTPNGQNMEQTIPHADSAADCGTGPGWYYDDNLAPTKINLCPISCASISGDVKAKINVAFGCTTQIN